MFLPTSQMTVHSALLVVVITLSAWALLRVGSLHRDFADATQSIPLLQHRVAVAIAQVRTNTGPRAMPLSSPPPSSRSVFSFAQQRLGH